VEEVVVEVAEVEELLPVPVRSVLGVLACVVAPLVLARAAQP
jgi:CRISPR/Cas system CMR subunit Cmr4 (Cas7 group RAMP superfamily)